MKTKDEIFNYFTQKLAERKSSFNGEFGHPGKIVTYLDQENGCDELKKAVFDYLHEADEVDYVGRAFLLLKLKKDDMSEVENISILGVKRGFCEKITYFNLSNSSEYDGQDVIPDSIEKALFEVLNPDREFFENRFKLFKDEILKSGKVETERKQEIKICEMNKLSNSFKEIITNLEQKVKANSEFAGRGFSEEYLDSIVNLMIELGCVYQGLDYWQNKYVERGNNNKENNDFPCKITLIPSLNNEKNNKNNEKPGPNIQSPSIRKRKLNFNEENENKRNFRS